MSKEPTLMECAAAQGDREALAAVWAKQDREQREADALAAVTQKIGDTIYYVREIVVKDTHERRGRRLVRVRYEQVKRFEAREAVISSIDFDGAICFNHFIRQRDLCDSLEEAKAKAAERQRSWDEHCAKAAECR